MFRITPTVLRLNWRPFSQVNLIPMLTCLYSSLTFPPGSPGVYNPLQSPLLYTGRPEEVRPMQFNKAASSSPPLSSLPPLSPPASSDLSSPRLSYKPGGLVALSWNGSQPSSYASGSPARQSEGPRFVQEEDAGTLSSPQENVVRLPPDYKEAWSQD
jgi:hypothetical protein